MVDEEGSPEQWVMPTWLIAAAAIVMGLVVGLGAVLLNALTDDREALPPWLSFLIGAVVWGGGTSLQLVLRRRARLRGKD
jgi:hypothetical protein